jgi:hypothetical protein
MDVSELRKRIIRALDDARRDATMRRGEIDAARAAYEQFLNDVAVPTVRQAGSVLRAQGFPCNVDTPADSVRLSMAGNSAAFLEIELDAAASPPQAIGRLSVPRGSGIVIDEQPVGAGKSIAELTEEDLAAFLVSAIPRLVVRS